MSRDWADNSRERALTYARRFADRNIRETDCREDPKSFRFEVRPESLFVPGRFTTHRKNAGVTVVRGEIRR